MAAFGLTFLLVFVNGVFAFTSTSEADFQKAAYPTHSASMNIVDLFWSAAGQEQGMPYTTMISDAASRGFRYFRFAATQFWPSQMEMYTSDPNKYWGILDDIFDFAASQNCTLIPSILWNSFLFADMLQTPLGQMFIAGSQLNNFTQNYVNQIVQRYRAHPALLFWELGNEMNLLADLNMTSQQPLIAPSMGTPQFRTNHDNFSTDQMNAFSSQMSSLIRHLDPDHYVTSGFAIPRVQAEHLRASFYSPTPDNTPDSPAQFAFNLGNIHSSFDFVTTHMYPGPDNVRFNEPWDPYSASFLNYTFEVCRTQIGKLMYLGEYGQPHNATSGPRNYSMSALDAIVGNQILTSTMWVWEFESQDTSFSIFPGRDDSIIELVQEANQRLEALAPSLHENFLKILN